MEIPERLQLQIQRPVLQVHEIGNDDVCQTANHLTVERDKGDRRVVDAADHVLGLCGRGGVEHHERGRNGREHARNASAGEWNNRDYLFFTVAAS